MLIFNQFTPRPHASKEEVAETMAKFAEVGTGPGTLLGHYVKADGSGVISIMEVDDMESVYRTTLEYLPYMTIETTPIVNIDDAVVQIMDYLS
jgi:hypothetical protein|tara:strand:+ start:541 stop:819 length:279 start_codon:yes stop_codon:yes gene_type:complete